MIKRRSQRLLAIAALLALSAPGCAVGFTASGSPTVTTEGRVGAEAQLEVAAAGGNSSQRFFFAVAGGGGASGGAGYGLIGPELGVELFRHHRLSIGGSWMVRIGPRVTHGPGLVVAWPLKLTGLGGEKSFLALGPRLQAEVLLLPGGTVAGTFSLGLALKWVSFDTTANRW